MKLNIISQVWPKWSEVSKTVESKPSKNHLDSHLKSRSTRKKLALMYQKSLQKGRTSLSTGPRLAFSDTTTIMRISGQAHRTWAELRAILRNDERKRGKYDDVLWGRLGVGFRLGQTNEPARLQGLHALCGVAQRSCCLREYVFLFWMAVFWVAMFWSWLPMFLWIWLPMFSNVLSILNLLPFGLKPNKISIWDDVALRTSPFIRFHFQDSETREPSLNRKEEYA